MDGDMVASIFRPLIKVPIIIAIAFLALNIFSFSISYLRLVSALNSLQQIAMENNYIPSNEMTSFKKYMEGLDTKFLGDFVITIDQSGNSKTYTYKSNGDIWNPEDNTWQTQAGTWSESGSGNVRKQYGSPITCTITADYHFITPLQYGQVPNADLHNVDSNNIRQQVAVNSPVDTSDKLHYGNANIVGNPGNDTSYEVNGFTSGQTDTSNNSGARSNFAIRIIPKNILKVSTSVVGMQYYSDLG